MFKCKQCQKKFEKSLSMLIDEKNTEVCPYCHVSDFEPCEDFEKEYHKKLVRDLVPNLLKHQRIKYEATKITDINKVKMLILENLEAHLIELKKGFSAEILADIIENIIALGGLNKIAWEDIMQLRRRKIEKYGAFQQGTYLIWTEKKEIVK